jgi:hypothetical protein
VNVPLENAQLDAVEPFRMSMFAVPEPNVTDETVMLLFATKSVVAAKATTGESNSKIVRNFFSIW